MECRPVIALTMGDPAGVGPELCLRVLADPGVRALCRIVLIGSRSILERAGEACGLGVPGLEALEREDWVQGGNVGGAGLVDVGGRPAGVEPGVCSPDAGRLAYAAIDTAIRGALAGRAAAVVTAPINKRSLNLAGFAYPGHTEILAERTGCARYCMMLTSEALSVSFVTTHSRYTDAASRISPERVAEVVELTAEAMRRIRGRRARIGVCGLNPHAGEEGLFGDEESARIVPGIAAARARGVDVEGPLSPDAAFTDGVRRRFDAIVCQYHDQGHIPFKMIAFDEGVNVTLGLPIVRTSVDHGTAFDIAWRGAARPTSLLHAIRLAVALAG
jgi:4-hydroxythreonine-4-phosphate dehydrogenase